MRVHDGALPPPNCRTRLSGALCSLLVAHIGTLVSCWRETGVCVCVCKSNEKENFHKSKKKKKTIGGCIQEICNSEWKCVIGCGEKHAHS